MNVRAICRGRFQLPCSVEVAAPLFTPEGERRWAGASWDPVYPVAGAEVDDSAPGTVFVTESTGGQATWIVIDRRVDGLDYARVVPGRIAGTVNVTCEPESGGEQCRVSVTYDVTSLGPEGAAFVADLEAGFDQFLAGWRTELLAALPPPETRTVNR